MSTSLDLEFIQQSPFRLLRLTWLGLCLLIICLLTLMFLHKAYQEKQVELDEVAGRLKKLNLAPQHKSTTTVAIKPIPAETQQQFKTVVSELTIPWSALFEAIERADAQEVTLLNVAPNSKKQQVLITGEAKNIQEVLNYIVKLEAQPVLQSAYLQSHSIDETNVSKPVKFTVMAHWVIVGEK